MESIASSAIDELDMTLTGTGKGQGGEGPGNSNGCMPLYKTPTPKTNFGKKLTTYRKVHNVLTFGMAHNWISRAAVGPPAEAQRYLTTALAEVPWQKPFLYMTTSEYDLLPPGAQCKEMRVSIICRGVRIAFETASTTTSLATLNQIQNIQIGFGLNKTGWGIDRAYGGFLPAQPMRPTTIATPAYNPYVPLMYGNVNATIGTAIPNTQIGFKFPLQNYFTMVTKQENFGGTPALIEKITQMDGKTAINQTVASFNHRPKFGLLTAPLRHIRWGLPTNNTTGPALNVHTNGVISRGYSINQTATTSDATGDGTTIALAVNDINNVVASGAPDFSYLDDIDKTQYYKQGPWGQFESPEIQPSIHIGVQAVPALTTAIFVTEVSQWQDTQCDWELVCEMDVEEYQPTAFPYATRANVPAGDAIFRTIVGPQPAGDQGNGACTYAGLFPTNNIL